MSNILFSAFSACYQVYDIFRVAVKWFSDSVTGIGNCALEEWSGIEVLTCCTFEPFTGFWLDVRCVEESRVVRSLVCIGGCSGF